MWSDISLPREREKQMTAWREALHQYLCVACSLSEHCTIVTSSSPGWVESCVDSFAPNLKPLLDQSRLNIVHAPISEKTRRKHGSLTIFEKEMTDAKLAAMRTEATNFYSRYPKQSWKNILSLGDMKYEYDALQELAHSRQSVGRERLNTKAILLPRKPSLSELTLRLKFSCLMLPVYVKYNGNIDLDLRTAVDPLQAIARAVGMPQLGDVPFPRHAWGRTPMPDGQVADEALDEVAVAVHELLLEEVEAPVRVHAVEHLNGVSSSRQLLTKLVETAIPLLLAYACAPLLSKGTPRSASEFREVFHLLSAGSVSVAACCLWPDARKHTAMGSFGPALTNSIIQVAPGMLWLDCVLLGLQNWKMQHYCQSKGAIVRRLCQAFVSQLCMLTRRSSWCARFLASCACLWVQVQLSSEYLYSAWQYGGRHVVLYTSCWSTVVGRSWMQLIGC